MTPDETNTDTDGADTDLKSARRIVVKVGSALLVGPDGFVHRDWLASLCDDIAACRDRGQEIIVVTSGSVALGRHLLKLPSRGTRLDEKQAAAAVGQGHLVQAYAEMLDRHGIIAAQVLMTPGDTQDRRRFLNARNTLGTLLSLGVVPVINENDTVATEELRFGDNDRLGAQVAQMMEADTLVLLSDIDGLYTGDPGTDPTARHVPLVAEITPEIEAMAGTARPGVGTGGMVTKLMAARIAMAAGCRMAIAPGKAAHPLARLEKGGACTWFVPSAEPRTARKRWIGSTLKAEGRLTIDAGAVQALADGKSLLPAGVSAVKGDFARGALVLVEDEGGEILGRGLIGYPSKDARALCGKRSADIEKVLGYRGRDELIHRDDLVLEN